LKLGSRPSAPKPVAARSAEPSAGEESGGPLRRLGGSRLAAFNNTLANSVLHTLWLPAGTTEDVRVNRICAAMAALAGFEPRDEVEGMLAAQAVALHAAAMECFRRAVIPEQPGDMASRLRRDGTNLARAVVEMTDAIERRRGKGPKQVVRVERVVVQEGGQAVVGAVSTAKVPRGGEGGGDA
jgi:hypothetical protein